MRRIVVVVFTAVLMSFALSAQIAFADSCANVSRAAPSPTGPGVVVTKGNWVWLPSIGVPVDAWGFAPPGGPDSTGFPGANGNYTNGRTSSLLGMSANCPPGSNVNRQTSHGIQSGCE